MKRLSFVALVAFMYLHVCQARADILVDANIITGIDVSSSINAVETMLQVEGIAAAIQSPDIISAIQRGRYHRIGFTVFLWADGEYPVLVNWCVIGSAEDAQAAAAEMRLTMQTIQAAPNHIGTLTNLSGALDFGGELLRSAPFKARRSVLNILGNGEDNVGEDAFRARDRLVAAGVGINGVVIGNDPAVLAYFHNAVIGGPMAFALPVTAPEMLVDVLRRKFVTEIAMR